MGWKISAGRTIVHPKRLFHKRALNAEGVLLALLYYNDMKTFGGKASFLSFDIFHPHLPLFNFAPPLLCDQSSVAASSADVYEKPATTFCEKNLPYDLSITVNPTVALSTALIATCFSPLTACDDCHFTTLVTARLLEPSSHFHAPARNASSFMNRASELHDTASTAHTHRVTSLPTACSPSIASQYSRPPRFDQFRSI